MSTQRPGRNAILTLLQSRVGCVHSERGRQWHLDVTTVTCWLCPLRELDTMTSRRYYRSRGGCVHSESWIQWHPDVTTVTCWLWPLRERETMTSWRYHSHVLAVSTQRARYNDIPTLLQSRVGCVHPESGRQWHRDVTTVTCWLCPLRERGPMTSGRYYSHVLAVSTQRAGDNDIVTLQQSRVGCVHSESGRQWHPDVTTVTCWLCPLRERETKTSWRYYSHVLAVSAQETMTSWRCYSHVLAVSTQRAGNNDILTLPQSRVGCVHSESGRQWHPDVTTVTCLLCPLRERETMTSWRYYSHVFAVSTQREGDNDILTLLQSRVGCVHSESGGQWHPDVTTVTCWLCPLRERETMTSWRYYRHVLAVSTQREGDNDILTLLQSRGGCVHSERGRQWHPDVTTVTWWLCPLRER